MDVKHGHLASELRECNEMRIMRECRCLVAVVLRKYTYCSPSFTMARVWLDIMANKLAMFP